MNLRPQDQDSIKLPRKEKGELGISEDLEEREDSPFVAWNPDDGEFSDDTGIEVVNRSQDSRVQH
jgi:hypothetical protein